MVPEESFQNAGLVSFFLVSFWKEVFILWFFTPVLWLSARNPFILDQFWFLTDLENHLLIPCLSTFAYANI